MGDNKSNNVVELENETLLKLMQTYLEDQTPDNLNKLVIHLRDCRVLTPANLNDQKQATPVFIKNPEGDVYLPIYTDKDQLPENAGGPIIVNIPYLEANAMVAREDTLATGIVLNPFTTNLIFKNALILRIEEVEKKRKENPVPQAKTVQMTEAQYTIFERKQFEAVFVPKKFFAEGENFVNQLLDEKEAYVDQLFEESYQQKRMYPYLEEEFGVTPLSIDEDLQMIRLDLPKRDCPVGACPRVYFAWNPAEKSGQYFMIENTNDETSLKIAEITSNWDRVDHGTTFGEGTELQQVIDIVKGR